MEEKWVKVEGYIHYLVSDQGKIKSLQPRWKKAKLLKGSFCGTGYLQACLTDTKGDKRFHLIHRLVMRAFVGESDLDVNHKNGNKSDNRLENLEYVTASANMKHAFATGLLKPNTVEIALKKRKPCEMADDKTGEVVSIFNSTHEAARQTGWNRGNISKACRENGITCGYRWRYL